MKFLHKFFCLSFVFFLTISLVSAEQPKPKDITKKITTSQRLTDFEVGRYQYCGKDSDCTVVNNGCCDCVNGGQDVAINKLNVERFRKRFACDSVTCGMKVGMHPCGQGIISCVNHKCHYIDDLEFKAKGGELKR